MALWPLLVRWDNNFSWSDHSGNNSHWPKKQHIYALALINFYRMNFMVKPEMRMNNWKALYKSARILGHYWCAGIIT